MEKYCHYLKEKNQKKLNIKLKVIYLFIIYMNEQNNISCLKISIRISLKKVIHKYLMISYNLNHNHCLENKNKLRKYSLDHNQHK